MISPFYLDLTEHEIDDIQQALGDILKSGALVLGPHTKAFESEFATYCGTKYAVALNTATSALEVLLSAQGVKGKRVAVASNTNFATVAAIIRAGGTPVYMDMTAETFLPDLGILEYTVDKYEVAGVLWVHIGGIIAPDFQEIVDYCRAKDIFLLEDAAHAHGSTMNGVKAGAFADGAAFSFFPTKVMTTMEGGMITTDDEELAAYARSMRNQGKRDGDYGGLHHDLGNSWRITEISAYMGLVQLSKLDAMVAVRSKAASAVASKLNNIGASYCATDHMEFASNYKMIVHLHEGQHCDDIKARMKEHEVNCGGGVYEIPCHLQPVFRDVFYDKGELAVTGEYCPRHICPPITSGTTAADITVINQALEKVLHG